MTTSSVPLPLPNPNGKQPRARVHGLVKTCRGCGTPFVVTQPGHHYCEPACSLRHRFGPPRPCQRCGLAFQPSLKRQRFCSKACRYPPIERNLICAQCGSPFVWRDVHYGRRPPTFCSNACAGAARRSPHPPRQRDGRYEAWRAAVLARDKVCQGAVERDGVMQRCGATAYLQAHHLKGWTAYPELRYALENGIALCSTCHGARHGKRSVGRRPRKRDETRLCSVCGVPITAASRTGMCYRHAHAAYFAVHPGRTSWEEVRSLGKTCTLCGVRISNKSTSGYCKAHFLLNRRPQRKILSYETVALMRARYAAGGVTYAQLAAEYGVDRVTAFNAINGRTWKG